MIAVFFLSFFYVLDEVYFKKCPSQFKTNKVSKKKTMNMRHSNYSTVVDDNINIMKTTFELNFDFYQTLKQHGYTKIWKQRKAVNLKSFTLITCKLVMRKKLVKT